MQFYLVRVIVCLLMYVSQLQLEEDWATFGITHSVANQLKQLSLQPCWAQAQLARPACKLAQVDAHLYQPPISACITLLCLEGHDF